MAIPHLPEAGPGSYVLLCHVRATARIVAGRLGPLLLQPGYYVYVGSALGPGGLRGRLAHHLRPALRPHWHIDYLRAAAPVEAVWFCYGPERREHLWARVLRDALGGGVPFAGFGSSDCNCASHLLFFRQRPSPRGFRAALCRCDPQHPTVFSFCPDLADTQRR